MNPLCRQAQDAGISGACGPYSSSRRWSPSCSPLAEPLGSRLQFLLLAWVIAIPILLALGPKASDPARRRWGFACGVALATVYGPFVVAALNTWLFDGTNTWLRVRFSYYLWLVPGGMLIELPFVTIWHQHSPLSPAFAIPFAGLLSAMVVAVTAWLIVNAPRARWGLLPLLASFFAWGTRPRRGATNVGRLRRAGLAYEACSRRLPSPQIRPRCPPAPE